MIRYYSEESLKCFQFCGVAKEFAKLLNGDELDIMDDVLGDVCGDVSDIWKRKEKKMNKLFSIYKGIVPKSAILFFEKYLLFNFFPYIFENVGRMIKSPTKEILKISLVF